MQVLPTLTRRQAAVCGRCDGILVGPAAGRVAAPLALTIAALLLLLTGNVALAILAWLIIEHIIR